MITSITVTASSQLTRLSADRANLTGNGAVNIQANKLSYLSLKYCNMGSGSSVKWNIKGCEIPNTVYRETGGRDTDFVSNSSNVYIYPEDLELWLEGNNIKIQVVTGDADDEDVGYYFRLGYVEDLTRNLIYRDKGGAEAGAHLRTVGSNGTVNTNDSIKDVSQTSWNYDEKYSFKDVGSRLVAGTKYHWEVWTTANFFVVEATNNFYLYPFG